MVYNLTNIKCLEKIKVHLPFGELFTSPKDEGTFVQALISSFY